MINRKKNKKGTKGEKWQQQKRPVAELSISNDLRSHNS